MKRLHASKHRPKRIIHISIQGSSSVSSTKRNQTQSSHLTFSSNTISSCRNHAVFTLV